MTIPVLGEINRLGFGTIHVTEQRGFGRARANARELLQTAAALGVNFFDTADSYGPGRAEEAIRAALHPYRGLVVATKGGYVHPAVEDWRDARRPDQLRQALEGSLRRLAVDAIDLYMLHTAEGPLPFEDSIGALKDFHDEGKIRTAGISRVSLAQLRTARAMLGDALVAVENCLNVFCPSQYQVPDEPDTLDVLAECERDGLAFISWAPLADGPEGFAAVCDASTATRMAAAKGCSLQRLLLAAVLRRSESIVAIAGTSRVEHLQDDLAAHRVPLTPDELAALWQ
jgi:pyridoxine 4-dehydrogenase